MTYHQAYSLLPTLGMIWASFGHDFTHNHAHSNHLKYQIFFTHGHDGHDFLSCVRESVLFSPFPYLNCFPAFRATAYYLSSYYIYSHEKKYKKSCPLCPVHYKLLFYIIFLMGMILKKSCPNHATTMPNTLNIQTGDVYD